MSNLEQTNLIDQEQIINTRKETWDSLFLFVDFSRMKEDYPQMWSKEFKLLPLPKPYQETKQKFTEYCQGLNGQVANLIESYRAYFTVNIYPLLNKPEGDKTLLFRCKRLLDNKIIGESSSLFLDLVIWEVEFKQVEGFKDLLRQLNTQPMFLTDREDELFASDSEKMLEGRINYSLAMRFWWKWTNLVAKNGVQVEEWNELGAYLKKWQAGKAAQSEWREDLKRMEEARDRLFDLGSENISDGLPFLQLGKIKEDTEAGLVVVGQNRKGFNLNSPYLRVVWFHQKVVRVYVVKGFRMVDPRKLYVEVRLEEDWVWRDLPWVVNSAGSINTTNHPVYQERNLLTNDNDPRILKEKHRLCFPFCSDLGNKEFCWPNQDLDNPINPTNLDNQINVKWALFRLRQAPDIFGGPASIKDTEILIPGAYYVEKVKPNDWTNLLMKSEQYDVFVAPSDYYGDKCLFKTYRKQLIIDLPPETKEQPHLFKHTAFQFCFLRDIVFSTNLLYMDIDQDNKIRATVDIYASPAGTYFIFKSGEIPFKWKLDVRQGIITWNLVTDTIESIQKTAQSIGNGILKFLSLGALDVSKAKKPMEKLTKELMTGKDGFKSMGLDREKINRIQELQTARMLQSTTNTGESMLEPTIFFSNSVQFPYNLYDFFLRSALPRYEARIHISKNLYNNLRHNNNENPITFPLNITFEKLGNILKPGKYRGELDLDYDSNGKMTECFARGVTFYEDKKKHFVNPDLRFSGVRNSRVQLGLGADFYVAQAITSGDEPWTNQIDRTKGSNFHQRAHFFITYEDGSKDHWLVLFPQSFADPDLAEGHHHGGFDIKFDKPVKEFIDVYTCIGCGAVGQGYTSLNSGYDSGSNDSLDRINKGLPYEPWFSEFTQANLESGIHWKTPSGKCLGSKGDVWEFTGQYIRGKDNKPFTEAYGFIPAGDTIRWITKGTGSTKLEWQKVPGSDDFNQLDWTPPAGSGGEIEIPLSDPEINLPDPGDNDPAPEPDFPEPDPLDPSGGEPEIPPLEPDLPPDIDPGQDPDEFPEIDPPEIEPPEIDPPEINPGQDPDYTPDPGDHDPPPDVPDDDPDGD